jgi:hypothetical protein
MFTIRVRKYWFALLAPMALVTAFGCQNHPDSVVTPAAGDANATANLGAQVVFEGALDVKPGSCPNPLNTKSQGVTPVAFLGAADFDVTDIDVTTLALEGVAPLRHSYEDVSQPSDKGDCPCSEDGPDGHTDLTLKFATQDIVAALGTVTDRETRSVTLTGELLDGTSFESSDCILILHTSIVTSEPDPSSLSDRRRQKI